ncbi:hypothetical protein ACHAWF_002970 [Thalassiosira exigua]
MSQSDAATSSSSRPPVAPPPPPSPPPSDAMDVDPPPPPPSRSPSHASAAGGDDASVGSASSSRSEERRRRRTAWRREHDARLRADGTFPRPPSFSSDDSSAKAFDDLEGEKRRVSERAVRHLGTRTSAQRHTLPPAVSDDVRVRSNLLRTLGIRKGGPSPAGSPAMTGGKGSAGGGGAGAATAGHHRRMRSGSGHDALALGTGEGGPPPASAATTPRPLLSSKRTKEELKYDSDEDVTPHPSLARTNSYSKFFKTGGRGRSDSLSKGARGSSSEPPALPRRRRLVFAESVMVVPIPMRSEYSNRIKERMYSGRVELSENAQRNVVEFESEGWDAATVLDDENQFYRCPLTGELIHPVHLAYFNKGGGDARGDQ